MRDLNKPDLETGRLPSETGFSMGEQLRWSKRSSYFLRG
jgi:hypothetical protein